MAKKIDMDGFAEKAELQRYKASLSGFSLGRIHPDHGVKFDAAIEDDRHLFIVAGSRAGKGTTMIIPNLINWPGGVFCIDPKGENASITAIRRGSQEAAIGTATSVEKHLEQRVAILDPFETVRGPARRYRIAYNPLNDIDPDSDDATAQIISLAEAMVISEGGKDTHFSESAITLLAGLIEAVLHTDTDNSNHSLAYCRKIAMRGVGALREYLSNAPTTDSGLADEAFGILMSVGDEEGGSFISTLSRQLKWIADPRMQDHLEGEDFSLVDAVRNNWSVYVCIPPMRIPAMKRWLRTIVRIALDAKMSSSFEAQGFQSLFLLDEFYALGHFPLIEEAAAYMAGYGIKLVPIIQNIGQVKKLYGKNWETFLGNSGAIIAWGLNDYESEKYISDRLGTHLVWENSFGESRNRGSGDFISSQKTQSENQSLQERAIRWPSEIHHQGARGTMRAFVLSADGMPFTIQRREYMEDDTRGLFDSPDFIRKWEDKHFPKVKALTRNR